MIRQDGERLLAAARSLEPLIHQHAERAEREGRLSAEVIRALTEAGLFRMLLPRALGGLEIDPVTCSLVTEELAGFHSAAGWAIQAGNAGAWWAARLPEQGSDEVYSGNPSAVVAAAFHPPQQAIETSHGYRVTGRGPLASNIHDAQWLFLTALIMDGERDRMNYCLPDEIGLMLSTGEVRIVDTWDSLGMRAADSIEVVIENVFLPKARTFARGPQFEPSRHYRGPLYRFPGIGAAVFSIAPVPLAVARAAIGEVRELAGRKTAFGFTKPLRERSAVQAALARAEGLLRAARLLYYDTMDAAWRRAVTGEGSTLEQKADILLGAVHAVGSAATVTDAMHRIAGTTGIYTRNPLERHFRDAQTLRHHGFLSENRLEAIGQVYLGLPPEFPMIAF